MFVILSKAKDLLFCGGPCVFKVTLKFERLVVPSCVQTL